MTVICLAPVELGNGLLGGARHRPTRRLRSRRMQAGTTSRPPSGALGVVATPGLAHRTKGMIPRCQWARAGAFRDSGSSWPVAGRRRRPPVKIRSSSSP